MLPSLHSLFPHWWVDLRGQQGCWVSGHQKTNWGLAASWTVPQIHAEMIKQVEHFLLPLLGSEIAKGYSREPTCHRTDSE